MLKILQLSHKPMMRREAFLTVLVRTRPMAVGYLSRNLKIYKL